MSAKKGFVNVLQEFSIPLIAGVFVALAFANLAWDHYEEILHWQPIAGLAILGHTVDFHWLVNDVFMVFFFGIAAKEITESALPGGSLNPIGKALNPLMATLGGVLGPIGVFFGALFVSVHLGLFPDHQWGELQRGWGVPTATDIALAWLVARGVFGAGHPAVNFLLLLAVADDAIGLGIIAVFYGDPQHPADPSWLLLVLAGMALALVLRLLRVSKWQPYVLLAGPLAWSGLVLANLHPALALVFIVPFLPGPTRDTGMFAQQEEPGGHSPLHAFEHDLKLFVDIGLFFFAFANAGVQLAGIGAMTWIILGSLVIGKTIGITLFGLVAVKMGFPLPSRMGLRELAMAGFVAALGLTVALFVATAAFVDPHLLGQAKMGALFSGFVGLVAIAIARLLGLRGAAPAGRANAAPTGQR
jgi:NhaA family Na+:H+ antiporter